MERNANKTQAKESKNVYNISYLHEKKKMKKKKTA